MKKILLPPALLFLFSIGVFAQIPKPEDVYGFKVGADYKLARYDQMLTYYNKLVASSDRIQMIEIGQSVMGKPIKLFIISSSENMKAIDKWKETSAKLARARIKPDEAHSLAATGKAIVWIDGGMHAREAAHAQMTSELAYKLVAEENAEMKKIRDNVVILLCPVINPDGVDIVADWYYQNLGTPYETTDPPILYQKYVGHDNNRDWFMNNMPETRAATNILYREWYPQIVHNHHQTSPAWARIFLPPFRSPVNPKIHPGVTTGVNLVGTAMANRFAMKKMPGVISGTFFSMWWNGGMRTAPYYHNQLGILTETAHRTPTPRYYDPDSIPKNVGGKAANATEIYYPYPWKGGESHFRDAVEYMMTASMGILDFAADRRENLLFNMYQMGLDAIEKDDNETVFAYIIPKSQWDSGEARNLVNILLQGGVEIHQATKKFKVADKEYPAGSVIAYGGQAFRPFLEDLMEKQSYPDQYRYPGGPPMPPYDLAGWTLPMQMGIEVIPTSVPFKAKTKEIAVLNPPVGQVTGAHSFGYLLSNKENNSYTAFNLLQQAGGEISQLSASAQFDKAIFGPGSFLIWSSPEVDELVARLAVDLGLNFQGLAEDPGISTNKVSKIKVGIYKSWRANMDEGWTRWVLDQHQFDLDTLHDNDIRESDLTKYSAIIIPSQRPGSILNGHPKGTMPENITGGLGLEGIMKIKQYTEQGGTLIALDAASDLVIEQFGLPVENITAGKSSSQFFIPGSLVRAKVDTENPLAYGVQPEIAASFSRSRAFKIKVKSQKGEGGLEKTVSAPLPAVKTVVRYAEKDILMSGWAKGQNKYLKNKAAMMDVSLGNGHIILFGFKPQFRGQPRASYKLLFNAILMGGMN
jgi:zinc carboxypeptidase